LCPLSGQECTKKLGVEFDATTTGEPATDPTHHLLQERFKHGQRRAAQ
jgi:hypothetical protein